MKRKYADLSHSPRILEKKYRQYVLTNEHFSGTVSLVQIEKVTEPGFIQINDENICIIDAGYEWLIHVPDHSAFVMTTIFNERQEIVQWYIDICEQIGKDEREIPWFDDIYLDIRVLPTGEVDVLDADEIEEALSQGVITNDQHEKAWKELNRLLALIRNRSFPLITFSRDHLDWALPLVSPYKGVQGPSNP
ncbi:DUF402 domain-containing protein [Brevibacillus ginsengisoli]|uniref:DUF402 domain-containing protein n=1 Tax=Brevibacillus ginsengisoli TaxID=363854 RepID=UPI003CED0C18